MEIKGFWWLKGIEECRSSGIYIFNNDALTLTVEGDSKEPIIDIPFNSYVKYIYGRTDDAKHCTLSICSPISGRMSANGQDSKTITADYFIKGELIADIETYKSNSARIVFNSLRAWMNLNPFKSTRTTDGIITKYHYPKSNKLFIPTISAHIYFLYSYEERSTIGESVALHCTPYIEITPTTPRNIDWFISVCNKINQLLSLLSGFKYTCSSLSLDNNSKPRTIHQSDYIEIHSKNILNFSQSETKDRGLIFINKHEIESQLAPIIDNWFSVHEKFENVIDLFYDSLTTNLNSKWAFLNLTFAAENIHSILFEGKYTDKENHKLLYESLKPTINNISDENFREIFRLKIKYGNDYSLQDKILELLCCSGKICIRHASDIESFSRHVSKGRNSLAHGKTTDLYWIDTPYDLVTTNTTLITMLAFYLLKQLQLGNPFIDNKFINCRLTPYI